MTTNEMLSALETILKNSKLDNLFKLGRVKIQDKKMPFGVSYRLKLHNPYTLIAFELTEKKNGLKFAIHHTKDMPKEIRKKFLELGGSPNNGNTCFFFDYESSQEITSSIYAFFLKQEIISLCNAEEYKPLKIIKAATL